MSSIPLRDGIGGVNCSMSISHGSSWTGEGGRDRTMGEAGISPSSDRSGTDSGGSADREGLRPVRLFTIGDIGTDEPRVAEELLALSAVLTDSLSPANDSRLREGSLGATTLAMDAVDFLVRGTAGTPVEEELETPRL